MRIKSRRGFTLVELLIVVGIIALLIAILMPVLAKAREQARQIICANNEHQIVLAMFMYANDNRGILPIPAQAPNPNGSVMNDADSPAIAQGRLTDEAGVYHWDRGTLWVYVGSRDLKLRERMFNCPSDDEDPRVSVYGEGIGKAPQFLSGRNFSYTFNEELMYSKGISLGSAVTNPFGASIGCRLSRIKAPEHKIFIVEEAVPSTESCLLWEMMVTTNWLYHPLTATRHTGCANIGMGDGHVERLTPDDLPPATQLLTVGQGLASTTSNAAKWHYWGDFSRVQ